MPSRRSGASSLPSLAGRLDEIIGLLLVAFAVFLALALWTFHPGDPSWGDRVGAGWAVRNYGGRVGAYLAGWTVQLLGAFAALVPLGLLAWGVAAFAGIRSWRPGWRELGALLILLSAAGMFYKAFRLDPLFGKTALAGGAVGYGVAVLLEAYLGRAGSWVALAAVFLAVLVATTGLSLGRLFALLAGGPLWAGARLVVLLGRAASAAAAGGGSALRRVASATGPILSLPGRVVAWEERTTSDNGSAFQADSWESPPSRRGRGGLLPPPEEEAGAGPTLFGRGQKYPEALGLPLPGPAAEGEERDELDTFLFGPAAAPEISDAPRRKEPEAPGPAPFSAEAPLERPAAGGIRIGRHRGAPEEEEIFSPSPVPAEAGSMAPPGEGAPAAEEARPAAGPAEPMVRRAGVGGEPEIVRIEDDAIVSEEASARPASPRRKARPRGSFAPPSLDMFVDPPAGGIIVDEEAIRAKSRLLEQTLREFGVEGSVTEVKTGPVVTIYEFSPAPGVKVSKIAALSDDLARALSALTVRIVAPIPGRSVVGIEVPNLRRNAVYMKEILSSPEFTQAKEKLTISLGKDILGRTSLTDLAKIPHLLIAGTTGSGKSVALNMMICSLLVRCMPRELRFLMIDPKMLELSLYEGVPHLLVPVVTDPKKAASALRGVIAEMERRYRRMSLVGARSIERYNELVAEGLGEREAERRLRQPLSEEDGGGDEALDFMPYIVVVIDELADLMMFSSREVEESMIRLAQMARAAGIHLLVATQRPSVDVLTGLIKANFPSRIALRAATRTDSRTILDMNGAERLLGKGDMLFVPPGASAPIRIHGAYVSDKELARLVAHWREQGPAVYQEEIFLEKESPAGEEPFEEGEWDELYDDAVALVARTREASISLIQRHLRIGYNRAARMIERMEQEGVIGPADGVKRRQVLIGEIPGEGARAG